MIGKSHQALASQSSRLTGLRIQSSVYGTVITLVFGTNRVSSKLLGYQDFEAHPQKSGSKKAGGGKKGQSGTQYTYSATIEAELCTGPITGIGRVWDSRGNLLVVTATQVSTVPGGGGNITVTPPSSGNFQFDQGVTRADAYSVAANDYGSDGPVTLAGTQQKPLSKVGGSPGTGQYQVTGAGAGRTYTFAAGDAGKTVSITYTYAVPNSQGAGYPTTSLAVTVFLGGRPQSPWSYLTSTHPGQDLSYAGIAYIAEANTDLGSSGALPNLNWEVFALLQYGGGIIDAEPSAIVNFILTDPNDGLGQSGSNGGWDPAWVGDLTNWMKYNVANGLFLSPVYDSQQDAATMIQELCDQTNTQPVWSEGKLKFKTYGDTTVVGNGQTFTPNTQPVYDIGDEEWGTGGGDPVQQQRASVINRHNSVQVEFVNRVNNYNPEIAELSDQNAAQLYGLKRQDPKRYHGVTDASVAKKICDFMVKRQVYILSTYTFTLDRRFILLEPMDLVTLTDSILGLVKLPVRITKITENEKGDLIFEAEEFPWGTAQPTLYGHQTNAGYTVNGLADPGSVNAPIIFEPTNQMTGGPQLGYEIWIGVSGASLNWGGCQVFFSVDGTEYDPVGKVHGNPRMGPLTASLADHADPDSTNTLSVDLTQSLGALVSVSLAQADRFDSLSLIYDAGGTFEAIAWETMNLTALFKYTSNAYLRRGILGTTHAAHTTSAKFLQLDDGIFVFDYDPVLIGSTVYFKFCSFNNSQVMQQPLSAVTAYPYTIIGGANSTGRTISLTASFQVNWAVGQTVVYVGIGVLGTGAAEGMYASVSLVHPIAAGFGTPYLSAAKVHDPGGGLQVQFTLTDPTPTPGLTGFQSVTIRIEQF